MAWKNPFGEFIVEAESFLTEIQRAPEIHDDPSLIAAFVHLMEERDFAFDIIDRLKSLHYCFERLHNLAEQYRLAEDQIDFQRDEQKQDAPECTKFNIPDEMIRHRELLHREAIVLMAFAYHEISALVTLLRAFFKKRHQVFEPQPSSELEYLIGVRDKLLVHPEASTRIKNSRAGITVGSILHAHLVGGTAWSPLVRKHYMAVLSMENIPLDETSGTQASIQMIRAKTHVENLKPEQKLKLKTFTLPEPDPVASAEQLALLLTQQFLPELSRICKQKG